MFLHSPLWLISTPRTQFMHLQQDFLCWSTPLFPIILLFAATPSLLGPYILYLPLHMEGCGIWVAAIFGVFFKDWWRNLLQLNQALAFHKWHQPLLHTGAFLTSSSQQRPLDAPHSLKQKSPPVLICTKKYLMVYQTSHAFQTSQSSPETLCIGKLGWGQISLETSEHPLAIHPPRSTGSPRSTDQHLPSPMLESHPPLLHHIAKTSLPP